MAASSASGMYIISRKVPAGSGQVNFFFDGCVIDLHGVVGRSAAGEGDVGDDARIAEAAGIHTKFFEVIVAEQFTGHLGNAVHGGGALDGILRGVILRGGRTKSADGTREKDGTAIFTGNFKEIEHTAHAHIPCTCGLPSATAESNAARL